MFAASRCGPVISHAFILSTVFRHRCLLFEGVLLGGEDSAGFEKSSSWYLRSYVYMIHYKYAYNPDILLLTIMWLI